MNPNARRPFHGQRSSVPRVVSSAATLSLSPSLFSFSHSTHVIDTAHIRARRRTYDFLLLGRVAPAALPDRSVFIGRTA